MRGRRLRGNASALVLLIWLCGCGVDPAPPYTLGTFPYHPLVFNLDLAILAYQLHCQSLVWPMDPFYEERADTDRSELMTSIRAWAVKRGSAQAQAQAGLDAYRGPGSLSHLDDNPTHDPIIYDYARIHPWSDAVMNAAGTWTEYLTPHVVTRRIRDVYVSARTIGGAGDDDVTLTAVPVYQDDRDADATDVLLAFEGGTGDKGEPGQPASYSLMGFVLVRDTGGGTYDVHVVFRGSRSGSAERAVDQAISTDEAAGNPDWITDLGWVNVDGAAGAGDVTTVGGVARGFARSMKSILPTAFQCLSKVAELRSGAVPNNIYVTGHSLGGGLAQHFASAVLLGDRFGPGGEGPAMPASLEGWPWKQLKLISFSAPRAGDYDWAYRLTRDQLQAQFFDPGPVATSDGAALVGVDPSIAARLSDTARPAGFRVLVSTDPVTTTKIGGGGNHVGTTVYVNGQSFIDWIGPPNFNDHEPAVVRKYLTDAFADPKIPQIAWRYRELTELVPTRDASQKGTRAELEKLAEGVRRYYSDRGQWFDSAAFSKDVELMFAIQAGTAN
jgi:hypothetical protein